MKYQPFIFEYVRMYDCLKLKLTSQEECFVRGYML